MRFVARAGLLIALAAGAPSVTVHAADVSAPVGLVRLTVPAAGRVLASMPFHPLGTNVASWLSGDVGTVNILGWNAVSQQYAPVAGVTAGDGFWIENAGQLEARLALAGDVVLDAVRHVPLVPKLNLVGYPFSQGKPIADSALWPAWQSPEATADDLVLGTASARAGTLPAFLLGSGYWYRREGDAPLLWDEPRPYGNPFVDAGRTLSVASIELSADGQNLSVDLDAATVPEVDLFTQVTTSGVFQATGSWHLAATIAASGGKAAWAEPAGGGSETAWYVVAADARQDDDGNGIADGRELLLAPDDPARRGLGRAVSISDPVAGNAAGTGATAGRTIHVSATLGDDHFDGRARLAEGAGRGPKRTFAAAIREAQDGDTVLILPGVYHEDCNASGKNVTITGEGEFAFR